MDEHDARTEARPWLGHGRRVAAATLAALLLIGTVGAPDAYAGQGKARPIAQCVFWNEGETSYAVFGYESRYATTVNIAMGSDNFFFPSPSARGQPTTFAPGSS